MERQLQRRRASSAAAPDVAERRRTDAWFIRGRFAFAVYGLAILALVVRVLTS